MADAVVRAPVADAAVRAAVGPRGAATVRVGGPVDGDAVATALDRAGVVAEVRQVDSPAPAMGKVVALGNADVAGLSAARTGAEAAVTGCGEEAAQEVGHAPGCAGAAVRWLEGGESPETAQEGWAGLRGRGESARSVAPRREADTRSPGQFTGHRR